MPDLQRQSRLFGAPLRFPAKDAETASHKFLTQGGFVHQLAAGIFSLLPLGLRVHRRIEEIIRQEMVALGAQEVLLPSLQPKALWETTNRWTDIDPPLFTLTDRHDRAYALAPTHEEVVTELARTYLSSYKQLPVAVFQLQTKFRNEQRSTGGLLRTREFVMKDLYSFHATEEDLRAYYERVKEAYVRIFERCGLRTVPVAAVSGSIGGPRSHEFALLAETGEDRVAQCPSCGYGAKVEALPEGLTACPVCGRPLEVKRCIENGHIFQLGQKYSKALAATFATESGVRQVLTMGCYGIGVGRLLAAIVESSHDTLGIRWPLAVAPYDVHVIELSAPSERETIRSAATRVAEKLLSAGFHILQDDRDGMSAGEKFSDADLIGIPMRVVVSKRHVGQGSLGLKRRDQEVEQTIKEDALIAAISARAS